MKLNPSTGFMFPFLRNAVDLDALQRKKELILLWATTSTKRLIWSDRLYLTAFMRSRPTIAPSPVVFEVVTWRFSRHAYTAGASPRSNQS